MMIKDILIYTQVYEDEIMSCEKCDNIPKDIEDKEKCRLCGAKMIPEGGCLVCSVCAWSWCE